MNQSIKLKSIKHKSKNNKTDDIPEKHVSFKDDNQKKNISFDSTQEKRVSFQDSTNDSITDNSQTSSQASSQTGSRNNTKDSIKDSIKDNLQNIQADNTTNNPKEIPKTNFKEIQNKSKIINNKYAHYDQNQTNHNHIQTNQNQTNQMNQTKQNNKSMRINGRNITVSQENISNNIIQTQYPNNWSPANVDVLRNWKLSLAKASFIYQYFLETTRTRLNRILVIALIISTISTIISGISTIALTVNSATTIVSSNLTTTTTTENPTYKLVALIINAIVFFLSAVMTLLTGIIKIYKLDETVALITPYIARIDQIYSKIANELVLPDSSREDAITFIKRESDNYLNLIQQSPDIDKSIESQALLKYNDYLKDNGNNFRLSQKYGNDAIIDVT